MTINCPVCTVYEWLINSSNMYTHTSVCQP